MTELERHLLNALEQLQQDYMQRLNEWENARGIAENVFAYATGQRDAERASHAVESAGAALERADRTLEPVIQREQEIRDERLMQEREHELSLERERQPEIQERTLDGLFAGMVKP